MIDISLFFQTLIFIKIKFQKAIMESFILILTDILNIMIQILRVAINDFLFSSNSL